MATVVSGFSATGYTLYGKQFIETFHQFAPESYDLVIYTAHPVYMPRGGFVLHDMLDGARDFLARHAQNALHCGKAPAPGWRKKDERAGYSYRHDAVKFFWQLLYPAHTVQFLEDGDCLAWFDGDVVFKEQIPTSFIAGTLAGGHDLAYLGRVNHSELGYWAVRVNPVTRQFLANMANFYLSDQVFNEPEWHSAYVFDYWRQRLPLRAHDMTPGGKGNVWDRTQLADFCTHLKGKLKHG